MALRTRYLSISDFHRTHYYVDRIPFKIKLDKKFVGKLDAMVRRYCRANKLKQKRVRYNWSHRNDEPILTKYMLGEDFDYLVTY